VVMLTGYGTIESAVEALRLGAADYLTKPVMDDELRVALERALRQQMLMAENTSLRRQLDDRYGLDNIVGGDHRMQRGYERIAAVAPGRTNETGEGAGTHAGTDAGTDGAHGDAPTDEPRRTAGTAAEGTAGDDAGTGSAADGLGAWLAGLPGDAAIGDGTAALARAVGRGAPQVVELQAADLATLSGLNHPALLAVIAPDGSERTILLRALDAGGATLAALSPGAGERRVAASALQARWTGRARVLWWDFEELPELLAVGARGPDVAWLQRGLASLGFYEAGTSGRYGPETADAVQAFQRSRGLRADGAVGPLTKMALYDALPGYTVPRLASGDASEDGGGGGLG